MNHLALTKHFACICMDIFVLFSIAYMESFVLFSKACEKTCYQRNVIETCGCADPQYPSTGEAFGNGVNRSCDVRNITEGVT